jgi:hypothetical protein
LQFGDSSTSDELFYLFGLEKPDTVLLRWLRARKWQVPAAMQFIMETLRWRHDWGLRRLVANGERDLVPEECASGKIYSMGKDKAGRPVTYVHASEHIKGQYSLEATEKLIILLMETSKALAVPPIEDGTVVIDMDNVTLQNLDYQHIKFMINAMQNCYPECLGSGFVVNAPWSFGVVWNVIKPWLDPVVASKLHFLKSQAELTEHIDVAALPRRLGGNRPDFRFIPSSHDDEILMKTIRQDKTGMEKAQSKHKAAAQEYLQLTVRWANLQTKSNDEIKSSRTKAAERLSIAFKELMPYISTRTHQHRVGDIEDSYYTAAYDRMRNAEDVVTHF